MPQHSSFLKHVKGLVRNGLIKDGFLIFLKKMKKIALLKVLVVTHILTGIHTVGAQIDNVSGDLLQRFEIIRALTPGSGTEGFLKPTNEELQRWRQLVVMLVAEDFERADSLIQADFPFYKLYQFTDTGLNNDVYYLLQENLPVTKGWGTFIVNPKFERPICIEIPHPVFDTNTYRQGADIFRRTGARFLIMAGTHRCANAEISPCDGTSSVCGDGRYHVSDMAHFTGAVFQAAHEIVIERFPEVYTFNLHGNSDSSCEDIFLSNGHTTESRSILVNLKSDLQAAGDITVAVAGDGTSSCSLVGSTNVQGRFTNGSPGPCAEAALSSDIKEFFIHVEQRRRVRDNFSVYAKLIDAINKNISIVTSVSGNTNQTARQTPSSISMFPNPFTSSTIISYELLESGTVSLRIYNLRGQLVRVLEQSSLKGKGIYQIEWNGFDHQELPLANGSYFVELKAGKSLIRTKVTLLR